MLFRSAALASAGLLLLLGAGCAGGPPMETVLPQAVAPSQSQHPDPNAPYVVRAPTRNVAAQPTPAAAAEAPPCTPEALKVEEIAGNTHGSWHSIKVGFRNEAGAACRLSGYPLVALFNPEGQSVGSIAVERTTAEEVRAELAEESPATAQKPAPPQDGTNSSQHVVLMPKGVAAFQVVWAAGANCSSVARLLVTPPGTTRTFSVAQPMNVCTGRIQVTPLGPDQGDD